MQKSCIIDQTRPDQTRPDQTRPDHPIVRKQERNSSLELLRIVAMLMIIVSHVVQHGVSIFPADSIVLNRLVWQFLRSGGNQGNIIFVMLSGYFLVKYQEVKFSKILSLIFVALFYAAVGFMLSVSFGTAEIVSLKSVLKSIIFTAARQWWFIRPYLIMYILHPYINIFLHGLTRSSYRKFLVTAFIVWGILSKLAELKLIFPFAALNMNNITSFMCLYSLAGYFRLWADDFADKKYILYGFAWIAVNMLVIALLDIIGLKVPAAGENAMFFCDLMMPFSVMAALCFLLGFLKLEISYNTLINVIASASLGVYLLHTHKFSQSFLWRELFRPENYRDSQYLIIYSVAVVFPVYIACTIIELIRSKIFRTLSRGYLS